MLKAENRIPQQRWLWASAFVLVLFMVLLSRFFQLQIYYHEKYKSKADVNRIRAITVNAPRGLILDRHGEILVDNYPTYVLSVIPEKIEQLGERFQQIEACTGLDSSILSKNYHKYYRGQFTPTRLAKNLTFAQISHLEENRLQLTGVQYKKIPERIYPHASRAAHILGYVNEVGRAVLELQKPGKHYELGDLIGWQGLEKQYEDYLRGEKGVTYFEVDAYGREMGTVTGRSGESPIPGRDLYLTIDAGLQVHLERELEGVRGVALVSNPLNGDIIAAVSTPDYPPDLFTGATPETHWNQILADSSRPLMNRITTGLYPPGSTFKILTALILLEEGLIDTAWKTTCTGAYHYGDRVFRCWNEYGHGEVDFRKAIAQSCNIYFYKTVQKIAMDRLADLAFDFGFGQETGVDFPYESQGVIPTKEYMDNKYGTRGWSGGALLHMAIGQGDVLVTPLQMINFINMVATQGRAQQLHFRLRLHESVMRQPEISDQTWDIMDSFLHSVVNDQHGTGKMANPHLTAVDIAGKTGTAENPHGEPHAWFVGYGKKEDQLVTVMILIENAGHGGEVAAPIARSVFRYVFTPSDPLMPSTFANIGSP